MFFSQWEEHLYLTDGQPGPQSRCERVGMNEGPIGRADDVGYSQGKSGETARCWRGGFCRFLPLSSASEAERRQEAEQDRPYHQSSWSGSVGEPV